MAAKTFRHLIAAGELLAILAFKEGLVERRAFD
jgi:hypothetical protein